MTTNHGEQETVSLMGAAPSPEDLQRQQCVLIVPTIDEDDAQLDACAMPLEVPSEAYPILIAGRTALQRLSTGWWSVTGEWRGEAFVAEEIREGVDSLNQPERVLWRRDQSLEQKQTSDDYDALDADEMLEQDLEAAAADEEWLDWLEQRIEDIHALEAADMHERGLDPGNPADVALYRKRPEAEHDAIVAENERAVLAEGMQALGLDPDNPEAVAAYQEWLECDRTPWDPPSQAQSLAYDRMMQFAAPAAGQQVVEEEWGDLSPAPRAEPQIRRQRQHDIEME